MSASGPEELTAAAARPREAVTDLYATRRLDLLRLATLLVDDPQVAEDVVQDAFLGLHRRWLLVRDPDRYLRTAVVNGCRSTLRRRRTARSYVPPTEPPAASAEDVAAVGAEHAAVLAAVRQLPRRQREVVVLRYWSGLTEAEIAAALGIAAGSVKAYASRALAALGEQMEAGA